MLWRKKTFGTQSERGDRLAERVRTVAEPCNPGVAVDTCVAGLAPDHRTPLACDLFTRSCAVPCASDAACTAAGLGGQACDTRTAGEVFGAAIPVGLDPLATHDACVNAICQ